MGPAAASTPSATRTAPLTASKTPAPVPHPRHPLALSPHPPHLRAATLSTLRDRCVPFLWPLELSLGAPCSWSPAHSTLVALWQVNETWTLEDCTVARCEGHNHIVLLEPTPVTPVACASGRLPIKVSREDEPCDYHYECECEWGCRHPRSGSWGIGRPWTSHPPSTPDMLPSHRLLQRLGGFSLHHLRRHQLLLLRQLHLCPGAGDPVSPWQFQRPAGQCLLCCLNSRCPLPARPPCAVSVHRGHPHHHGWPRRPAGEPGEGGSSEELQSGSGQGAGDKAQWAPTL